MNTFAACAILYVLFTAHDSGVRLPHAVPNSAGSALWAVREMMWSSGEALMSPHLLLYKAQPASMQRMHVDWILFAQPLQQLEAGASQITGYITVRQDRSLLQKLAAGSSAMIILPLSGSLSAVNFA